MAAPILVTGADGMLGSAVVRAARRYGVKVVGLCRQNCDITNSSQVSTVLGCYQDPTVINCAGIVRQRQDVPLTDMYGVNALGPRILAKRASRLVQVSTDCVFDGMITDGAYDETASPNPQDRYAETKFAGEVTSGPHLTIRASFVGLGRQGLLRWLLNHPEGVEVEGYTNWIWNGWTADSLALRLLKIGLDSRITGLVHLPGPEIVTKAWLLGRLAMRLRPDLRVVPAEASESRRMVLASRIPEFNRTPATWLWMLEVLENDFRAIHRAVARAIWPP